MIAPAVQTYIHTKDYRSRSIEFFKKSDTVEISARHATKKGFVLRSHKGKHGNPVACPCLNLFWQFDVAVHAINAATANPVKSLRSE